MPFPILLLSAILLFSTGRRLPAQDVPSLNAGASVTQCGADPTGKSDSTGAFNTCLKEVASGDLWVPGGDYKILGTIVKSRDQNLIGAGSKASILQCESTTAPCLVVADNGSVNDYSESRVQDITLQGPGGGNSSIGVFLGGDPAGKFSPSSAYGDSASFMNVRITGFNYGIEWGNNAWLNKVVRTLVFGNTVGLYVPTGMSNSGEDLGITDSAIFNNAEYGLEDNGDFEWMLSGVSFDYNGTAVKFLGSTIHAVNCHFEQSGGQVFLQPYGDADLSIRDSEILVQANSGSDKYILSTWPQTLNLSLDNVSIWSNHPVQYFMRVQGTVTGAITHLYGNANKLIGALSDAPSQAVLTASSAF
jgi:Pectate lyase superfamily protein